jgi:hypothetical protein
MNYHLIMGHYVTNQQLIIGGVILGVLVALVIGAFIQNRRTRTAGLKNRFGSEYERAVLTHGSAREAEAKLSDRETRVQALKIRELGATERERFVTEWQTIQSRFVDHPKAAVSEADGLINALLIARGYPQAEFEQRAADVSVHYPRVMEKYRIAHSIAIRTDDAEASTEEQRTAMIQYREMFDDLLQAPKALEARTAA